THSDTAKEILGLLLEKYIERGVIQFNDLSGLIKSPPFDRFGLPGEIANRHFGSIESMRQSIGQLQEALYQ
ncbi:MAG: hypothetical protein DM484_08715, partial [Candidatus Methylumidiphilus alinenensis]